jgi:predicted secreted protein
MAALSGKVAQIRLTAATATSSTDNAATLSTDGVTLTIDSTSLRHWNRASSTHVQVFEAAVNRTTDIAEINYVQGKVTLDTAHSTGSVWTIDVETHTSSYLGAGREWELNTAIDMRDHTTFSTVSTADAQWRTMRPGISGGDISISRFSLLGDSTSAAFMDRLELEQDTVVELIGNRATNRKFEAFAYVSDIGYASPVDGDVTEDVTLTVDGAIYQSTE